jgi:hypothetical protein
MNKLSSDNYLQVYACAYCGQRNNVFHSQDCEDCVKTQSLRKIISCIPGFDDKLGYGIHKDKTYRELSKKKKYMQYVNWLMSDDCKTSYENKKKMFRLYLNLDNVDFPKYFY